MVTRKVCTYLSMAIGLSCMLLSSAQARPVSGKKGTQRAIVKKTINQKKRLPRNKVIKPESSQHPLARMSNGWTDMLSQPDSHVLPVQQIAIEDASVPVQKQYSVSQGRTLHLKIAAPQPLKQAYTTFAGTQYNFSAVPNRNNRYECFVPIDCDQQPGQYKLIVQTKDELNERKNIGCAISIDAFPFKPQRGFSIPKKKLRALRSSGVGSSGYGQAIREYQKKSCPTKLWEGPFIMPINVRQITSPFGELRTSHGFGKRKHYGIDLAEHHKAPIHAANHGKIIHQAHSKTGGNTVVIDHGLGIFTTYCHMNSFEKTVTIGSTVKKGQRIGFVGQTGYASGPHLHLELRIKDANNLKATAVDFMEWTKNIY